MATSDRHRDLKDSRNFNLASEIVELVVFTTDTVFLQTLRDAVGGSRRLWHVPSADKVSDLLLAGQVGILVLDVQSEDDGAGTFVAQIKRQFPDLVVVVAGNREAETSLAKLISDGTVYRFIHKPMSPGRAKLFADVAVKKFADQRKVARLPPPAAHRSPAIPGRLLTYLGAGLAAAAVCAALVLVIPRMGRRGPDAPPSAGAPGGSAAGDAARAATAELREHLLADAESALLEERLDAAATAIEAARAAGVESGRIAFLDAQLAKTREQQKRASALARSKSDARAPETESADEHLQRFLNLAAQRLKDGRLIAPDKDNAKFYIQEAMRIDPNGNATQAAKETLAKAMMAQTHAAIERGDFARASALLDAAGGIVAASNIENARQQQNTARQQADSAQSGQVLKTPQEPIPDQRPDQRPDAPADDTAKMSGAPERQPLDDNVVDASKLAVIKTVKPVYPPRAELNKTEGWVELDFTIAESGQVRDISVRAANPPGVFDSAAIGALSHWQYQPVLADDKPVAQRARIRLRFALTR